MISTHYLLCNAVIDTLAMCNKHTHYVFGLCFESLYQCVLLVFLRVSWSITVSLNYKNITFVSNLLLNNCTQNMPRLSEAERNQAIGMLRVSTDSDVARYFNVSRKTIRHLKQCMRLRGIVADRPRTGRPRKTTIAEDRNIRTRHLRNRFMSAAHSARTFLGNQTISRYTVRRRLQAQGIICRRPVKRLRLTARHMRDRFNWSMLHRRWTLHQWGTVIFSDESRFYLERHDGRLRVYRRQNEMLDPTCIAQANRSRSVMVWGAISSTLTSILVVVPGNLNANRYINDILQPHLLPFIQQHNRGMIFQHDNAPAHRAHATRDFLLRNNVNVLTPWPAVSPDLNQIEHLWDRIDKVVREDPPATIQELTQSLIDAWNAVNQIDVRRLVLSMRRRCHACVNKLGGHTSY